MKMSYLNYENVLFKACKVNKHKAYKEGINTTT